MHEPYVTVVTPAYNAGPFLRQCIESVLAQRYDAFEHVIVDNGSTDDTRHIAESYARGDSRVRIMSHENTVPFVENWNRALEAMSPGSRYCQTLHADDWLYPTCLERLVAIGERHPSVGIIGSLRLRGTLVQCEGLPTYQEVFSGHEVVRMFLHGEVFALAPTSSMMRSDLVRARCPFYSSKYIHTDLAAYFDMLSSCDFGFCHEVLAFSRTHNASITSTVAERRQTLMREWPMLVAEYGPRYFMRDEQERLVRRHYQRYHRVLVRALATGADREFLRYHLEGMRQSGHRPKIADFAYAAVAEVASAITRPDKALRHLRKFL